MERTRRRRARLRSLVAGAVALAVPLTVWTAAPAVADPVGAVLGVSTDVDGTVHVALDTGAGTQPALWVKVSVLSSTATDATVLASTDAGTSTESGYGPYTSNWVSDAPLRLPTDAPRATYPVEVDYRLPGGTVQQWQSGTATPYDGRLRTTVTGTVDRTYLDYDHRTAVVSGTVTELDPATGTTATAPAGVTVVVHDTWRNTVVASGTTGDDGTFTAPVTPSGTFQPGLAITDASYRNRDDAYLPEIQVAAQPVRMHGVGTSVRVHAGVRVTIQGTVERLSDTGWVPLAGADIVTATSGPDGYGNVPPPVVHEASAADGSFSGTVTPASTTTLVTYARPTPYLRQDIESATAISVPVKAAFTQAFALDQFAQLAFRGRIIGPCYGQIVSVQFSPNGRTGWVRLGSVAAAPSGYNTCSLSRTLQGRANGFYRAVSAETDQLLAWTGPAVHLLRTITRIAGWTLTPTRPAVHGRITSTGVLQQQSGSRWIGLTNGVVELVWQPRGDPSYYLMAAIRTRAGGRFTLSSTVYGDGNWAVFYKADGTHFYSETAVRYVDAR